MDTPERSEGALSPWSPPPTAIRPASASPWSDPSIDAAPPKVISAGMVLRGLRRHWWQILAIWLVGSAGLVYLAYSKIRPTYEAAAWLEVEPASRSLMAQSGQGVDFGPYLDTQVLLVTSPDVLSSAINQKDVAALPRIKGSVDPEVELRKEIAVAVPQKGTHLIRVQMTVENPAEGATIVNAVVDSYLEKSKNWTDEETRAQIDVLKGLEKENLAEIEDLKKKVVDLSKKFGGDLAEAPKDPRAPAEAGGLGKLTVTMEQYRSDRSRLETLKVERVKAQAAVAFLDEEIRNRGGSFAAAAPMTPEQIEEFVKDDFLARADVVKLNAEIADAEKKVELAKRKIRKGNDPTLGGLNKEVANLKAEFDDMWVKLYPKLKQKATNASRGVVDSPDGLAMSQSAELRQARLNLKQLQIEEKLLEEHIKTVEIEVRAVQNEKYEVDFAREDLNGKKGAYDTVVRNRQQLEYEARNGTRIKVIARAKPTRSPSSNNRLKAMAAAPVIMLLLACGLFVFVEARSGRVADPDELSQRVRVGVIGVVPPLPSLSAPTRALSARGQQNEKRRVEEFVQSLDHLRVTLCAARPGMSARRCVLITSATGGEGKTTLAAQLAGRCANAGLMTLLIDADLRRPSLGDLLEVPEGPGLVDVLTGDATPEAAMVVIGNAGGFHLLPAGTMGQDPSRLLHGDRLGQVIARFRETFDIVIIDAPPVLAVPDALLLGRWTDGAVLAVRHDASRFPLVERANKRMASVGVPVLGAVVNGVRTMESAYGSYRYTPYAAAEAPGAPAGGDPEI